MAASTKRRPYRRDQILDAAAKLFEARGYAHTSMADIAGAVGLTAAALYQHFRDKEEILDTIVANATSAVAGDAHAVAATGVPPGRRLERLVTVLVDRLLADGPEATVAQRDRALTSERVRRRAARNERALIATWSEALHEHKPRLSEAELQATVHAARGVVYSVTHTRSGVAAKDQRDILVGSALAALGVTRRRPRPSG
jgi:AcrR family transcriptional regulator